MPADDCGGGLGPDEGPRLFVPASDIDAVEAAARDIEMAVCVEVVGGDARNGHERAGRQRRVAEHGGRAERAIPVAEPGLECGDDVEMAVLVHVGENQVRLLGGHEGTGRQFGSATAHEHGARFGVDGDDQVRDAIVIHVSQRPHGALESCGKERRNGDGLRSAGAMAHARERCIARQRAKNCATDGRVYWDRLDSDT
jgi:hypothetical protein